MIRFIEKVKDFLDTRKRKKALAVYPYQYIDRCGRRWFNTTYHVGYGAWRKWC